MHPSKTLNWSKLLAEVASSSYQGPEPKEPFWFGGSSKLCAELNALVLLGQKTATASLLWEWEAEGEALPDVGHCEALLSWTNEFLGIISTTAIVVLPFDEVSKEFAALEGEGDLSLRFWRDVHWSFFSNVCDQIGKTASMDMPVVCQEFKLDYIPNATQQFG